MKTFFGGYSKNQSACEDVPTNSDPNFLGQIWGNSGKIPSHPKTFAFSYTYGPYIAIDSRPKQNLWDKKFKISSSTFSNVSDV